MQTSELGFDADALRTKYQQERDRRLREDGLKQYIEVKGDFSHYVDDPYTARTERPPVQEDVEVLILGGGFAGLLAASRLKERGIGGVRIIEKGGDFGGTWYWNRYPGAQCDVESYIYLALLEETGFIPKEKYSYQPEIYAHAQRIGRHYGLYDNALFQTCVTGMRWSEDEKKWDISTDRGDKFKAQFVISCGGGQDRPRLPGVPGIDSYRGHTFHTSRWDYVYTGGDSTGNLTKLADKRVAIIGTGASAIQCVPFVAKYAKQLYVLQRTPSVVGVRLNRPTDPGWAKSLTPGWQARRMDNYSTLVLGGRQDEDLVDDGWTHATRALASVYGGQWDGDAAVSPEMQKLRAEISDFKYMEDLRGRVDSTVKDKETAEALKPWYRYFCKRPTFNDEFLPTFNRSNVKLIDVSSARGVERMTEGGFVVDGTEYDVDCVIYATGFDTSSDLSVRSGCDIVGRQGKALTEHWRDGARTLHGACVHGFPNLFLMGTVQTGFTINYTEMVLKQSTHIAEVVSSAKQRQLRVLEPTAEAEARYVADIVRGSEANFDFLASCTPGYFNSDGRPQKHGKGLTDAQFTAGLIEWNKMVEAWRADGTFEGMITA